MTSFSELKLTIGQPLFGFYPSCPVICRKSLSHFQPTDLRLIYQFISQHATEHPIQLLGSTLTVSRSSYYRYQTGETYQPTDEKKKLVESIQVSFRDHYRRYGSRRLVEELRDQGYHVGRFQVRQLMRQEGLQAIQPHSFVPRTTDSRHNGPFNGPISMFYARDKT